MGLPVPSGAGCCWSVDAVWWLVGRTNSPQRTAAKHLPWANRFHHHASQTTCRFLWRALATDELDGLGIWLVSLARHLGSLPSAILWVSMLFMEERLCCTVMVDSRLGW